MSAPLLISADVGQVSEHQLSTWGNEEIIDIDEMVRGPVIFAASGVTDSALMKGVRSTSKFTQVETLLLRSKTMSFRKIVYRKQNIE